MSDRHEAAKDILVLYRTIFNAGVQALALAAGEPKWGMVLADQTADAQAVAEQIQPWAGVTTGELAAKADRLELVPVLVLVPKAECQRELDRMRIETVDKSKLN